MTDRQRFTSQAHPQPTVVDSVRRTTRRDAALAGAAMGVLVFCGGLADVRLESVLDAVGAVALPVFAGIGFVSVIRWSLT
jgi:hypothetical protein